MRDSTIVILGVISAVVAAVIVEWLNRTLYSPTSTANDAAWRCVISGGAGCATGCSLPNYNLRPQNPAFTYQTGAPVTNYRSYQRVGVLEVPVSE